MRHQPLHAACFLSALVLLCPLGASAQSGKFQISATLGIGGRFRTGDWIPITVSVVNPGPNTLQGQAQVLELDQNGAPSGDSIFERPAQVPPGGTPQFFQVETRGIDPVSQNVAVRLVSDSDGGAVAQISSLADSKRNLFVGAPILPRDLLVVGFSADSTAITRLTGQSWGLMHTANGIAPDTPPSTQTPAGSRPPSQNAMVEAAAATAAEMPDRSAGYDGADAVILRGDAPLDALTEAQTDALKGWIASGGRLVVYGGSDPAPYGNAFYMGLLPAAVSAPAGKGTSLTLTPKPLPGVRVSAQTGGRPQIVTGPYGAGRVTLLAFDPAAGGAAGSNSATLWRQILATSPSSLLGVVAAREAGANAYFYGNSEQLSDTVMRAPSLDAPGTDVVALFLIAYVLILVPLNYLVLKRLDKKEWSWATIPALVFVFAAATYGVGYAAKGNRLFVNRAAVVETTVGRSEAGVYADIGLFSPRRDSYNLAISDPNALSAIPASPFQYYNNRTSSDNDGSGVTRFGEDGEDEKLSDVSVNMWAMRAFDVQTTTNLGGSMDSTLTINPSSRTVSGTITNHTAHALTHCDLFVSGRSMPLADLPPGNAAQVSVYGLPPAGAHPAFTLPGIVNGVSPDAAGQSVSARMQAAMTAFVNGVNGNNGGQYYYNGGNQPPAAFQPRANEAIFTGWSDDASLAGLPVRVDGHTVTENSVALVVVHIPLH